MNKKLFGFLLMGLMLVGCGPKFEEVIIKNEENTAELGEFRLTSPANSTIVSKDIPTFAWEESNNATSYILEVSSNEDFSSETGTYLQKKNIVDTSYTLDTYLRTKEINYYWRVTAVNKAYTKLCTDEYRAFYLTSPDKGEIEFNIDYADEWSVHEQGSQCNISVDKSDFFNNGKNSLMIDFTHEQTNTGNPSSDGWIVVTHTQETELYGVDSFYLNFYYNGQDSHIFLRVIDEDNEYYNAEIKLATNAQQTIIMRFDEFTLRTKGGTPIVNQKFDYNYIKAVELVFEQTFGDGICMISDLKAIHFGDYNNLFISRVDFRTFDSDTFIQDNYSKFVTTVSEDGKEFTVSYGSDFQGYGFLKVPVNKTLVDGDSFKVKLSHTGATSHKLLFRLIEEDGDRWVFRQPCNTMVDEEIVIPFTAFTLSEANGDGARQFYFIKQFQFGIESAYGAGSMTYSNLRVCYMEEEIEDLYINQIGPDGLIDDFESYKTNTELYYKWQETTINKDESMSLETQYTPTLTGQSGKFTYKTDMYPACYGKLFESGVAGFNGIRLDILDKSVLKNPTTSASNPYAHHGNGEAKMIITIYVTKGETYTYVIPQLTQEWLRYTISFNDFTLDEGFFEATATELKSENILGLRIDLQFYYYAKYGDQLIPSPQYVSANPVYIDNIYLTNCEESSTHDVVPKIYPSTSDPKVTVLEDFEDGIKFAQSALEYCSMELVERGENDTAIKFGYKGNSDSVAYTKNVVLDSTCTGRAIVLDIYGDGKATVYINIYFEAAGSILKYRAALTNVAEGWHTYTVGFDNFTKVEGTGSTTLSKSVVPNVNKISFGIVNTKDYQLSSIMIDNIKFDANPGYTAMIVD